MQPAVGKLGDEERARRLHDLKITNDLHVVLIHLCHPEAVGRKAYDAIAPGVFERHAANLRRIIQLDNKFNLGQRLLDLWDKDRGKDKTHTMAFFLSLLDILASAEDRVAALIKERDLEQPLLPFGK